MPLSAAKNVDLKAVAMPVVPLAAVVVCIAIMVKWGLAAGIVLWFLFVAAILLWGMQQRSRARQEIRDEIERGGGKVLKMNYRHLRLGPFSLWNSSRTQHVYRVIVQEASGRERIAWVRWGRRWYWDPDTLELKWQDEATNR
jgi:hypothetical protein